MIDLLIEKIIKVKNPTVVGLDPKLDYVPGHIKKEAVDTYGNTLEAVGEAFFKYNKGIIDTIWDVVPAVKPQIAMYEQYGYQGLKSYIRTIDYAKSKGLIVIGDVKRGDIASTAEAYSNGHIGRVKIGEDKDIQVYNHDFITLNPYLGYDSIEPYKEDCRKYNRGIFVLVKTSNPNSGQLQDLDVGGEKLYERVGRLVNEWGEDIMGQYGYSHIGAVVGATHPAQGRKLRELMPNSFFLVPGYGAQGGTAEDLRGCFDRNGLGAIINSSRGIITAYRNEKYKNKYKEEEYAAAAREAALDMKEDLNRVIEQ